MKKFFKIFKIVLATILSIIVLFSISFLIYANIYYHASDVDDYLKTDDYVTVTETDKYISFMPNEGKAKAGIIFYCGAKVEEKAYSEMMYDLAKLNIFTAIVKTPLRFSFFNLNGADYIYNDYKDKVEYFYLAGHSLGGVTASDYLSKNIDNYQGIIFLASYSNKNFKNSKIWSLSIYGSNDYVLDRNKYAKAKEKLPKNNYEYIIEGGNHANFASYGDQHKDGKASIERKEQINLTVLKIVEFIGLNQLTLLF